MNNWKAIIEVWPYFGEPQSEVAPRVREFRFKADKFRQAEKIADAILVGVGSHDKIWQANLWAVMRTDCPVASIT